MDTKDERGEHQYLKITSYETELLVQASLGPNPKLSYPRKLILKGEPDGANHLVERAELWFRDDGPDNEIPSYNEKSKTIIATYPMAEYNDYLGQIADRKTRVLKYDTILSTEIVRVELKTIYKILQ